jgi:hypothetical protein
MSTVADGGICRLAVALPRGRPALRLQLPPSTELLQVFDHVARETHQSPADCAKYYQLQACARAPPHEPLLLTAAADGARSLEECGLAPQAALTLRAISGSAASSPREKPEALTPAQVAAAVEEADRKATELEKVELFCAFTGADRGTAATILARVGWVVESATNHFFEVGFEEVEVEDVEEEEEEEAEEVEEIEEIEETVSSTQDHDRRTVTVEDHEPGPPRPLDVYSENGGSAALPAEKSDLTAVPQLSPQSLLPPPEPEPEPEPEPRAVPEGVTPPSGRDAWRTHDSQAKHLLHDWLAAGGLQSFAESWAEVGLDALEDFRQLVLQDSPADRPSGDAGGGIGSIQWALLPEPRPRLFEAARALRLLRMIDDAAESQGTAAPLPPVPSASSGAADPTVVGEEGEEGEQEDDGGGGGYHSPSFSGLSLSDWLSDAKLSEYEEMLVGRGGLVLADVAYVTQEELLEVGMEKEFHRKRFLRMAARAGTSTSL